jgi:hypothetical protein
MEIEIGIPALLFVICCARRMFAAIFIEVTTSVYAETDLRW